MKKTNHLTDEQLVDWIEGQIEDDTFIWTHLNQCQHCYDNFRQWKKLLQSDEALNEVDRKRVWQNVQEKKQAEEYQVYKRKKRWISVTWVASCIAFLMFGYWMGQGQNEFVATPSDEQDQIEQFIKEPVRHYDMIHSEGGNRQGIAWYNPMNRQMILYLDDPRHLDSDTGDVQIETSNRVIKVKPNHLQNGKMQFYLQDQELQGLMQLVVGHDENEQTYYFQVMTD
ncbi:hypothetical protein [Piscibacillus halophilus]|uniref:Uncharacterized protein n=1 Tax=Piscibacillus halophilus TaxID=571933 RepID=A0A1H9M4Q5_9BACI|nr:hypothetical protein [Piscibacillus halophilus]SER18499.1 hypothetical protein SAMN05216362_1565 [Piscibacillus halophilus]